MSDVTDYASSPSLVPYASSGLTWERAAEALRVGVQVTLALASLTSAYTGLVYWAVQGWLLGVILSVLLPGFGAASVILSLPG
jgi:hypothetical protein